MYVVVLTCALFELLYVSKRSCSLVEEHSSLPNGLLSGEISVLRDIRDGFPTPGLI
jgi:hypothetical protein